MFQQKILSHSAQCIIMSLIIQSIEPTEMVILLKEHIVLLLFLDPNI